MGAMTVSGSAVESYLQGEGGREGQKAGRDVSKVVRVVERVQERDLGVCGLIVKVEVCAPFQVERQKGGREGEGQQEEDDEDDWLLLSW